MENQNFSRRSSSTGVRPNPLAVSPRNRKPMSFHKKGDEFIVWVNDDEERFRKAVVRFADGKPDISDLTLENCEIIKTSRPDVRSCNEEDLQEWNFRDVQRWHKSHDEGNADLALVSEINEAAVLQTIRTRFDRGEIYTRVDPLLISVNPYRTIEGLYDIDKYHDLPKDSQISHIFRVGQIATENVGTMNQSICVNGESGSGKTEACKKLLEFITSGLECHTFSSSYSANSSEAEGGTAIPFSSSPSSSGKRPRSKSYVARIDKLLEGLIKSSHPILEIFGNASTHQNSNSSRFGKYLRIEFDSDSNICGANMEHYLLERSRVIAQKEAERNFHVFYAVFEGLSDSQLQYLHLDRKMNYRYLSSGITILEGGKDEVSLHNVEECFHNLGFSDSTINSVWGVLSAILHLGNIDLSLSESNDPANLSDHDKSGDHHSRSANDSLSHVALFLGLDESLLLEAITTKTLRMGKDVTSISNTTTIELSREQAISKADALAKDLYEQLFAWLISRCNHLLMSPKMSNYVAILDIFGFEVMTTNSFEQLCINYCNEKMQTLFNDIMFAEESKLFQTEGIAVDIVYAFNNADTLSLIEGDGGILRLLDEQCTLSRVSKEADKSDRDLLLLKQLQSKHSGKNPSFICVKAHLAAKPTFTINHFAGAVEYSILTFVSKNMDKLDKELIDLISQSSNQLVLDMYEETLADHHRIEENEMLFSFTSPSREGERERESIHGKRRPSSVNFSGNDKLGLGLGGAFDYQHRPAELTQSAGLGLGLESSDATKKNRRQSMSSIMSSMWKGAVNGGKSAMETALEMERKKFEAEASLGVNSGGGRSSIKEQRASVDKVTTTGRRASSIAAFGILDAASHRERDTLVGGIRPSVSHRKKMLTSIASKFRADLNDLVAELKNTQIQFIKCIKPNQVKSTEFSCPIVYSQLYSSGIMEVVKIRSTGFPLRYSYQDMHEYAMEHKLYKTARIRCVLDENVGEIRHDHATSKEPFRNATSIPSHKPGKQYDNITESIKALLSVALPKDSFHFGKTLIFLRRDASRLFHSFKSQFSCRIIQSVWRGHQSRKYYRSLTASLKILQGVIGTYMIRKDFLNFRGLVILGQSAIRMFLGKREKLFRIQCRHFAHFAYRWKTLYRIAERIRCKLNHNARTLQKWFTKHAFLHKLSKFILFLRFLDSRAKIIQKQWHRFRFCSALGQNLVFRLKMYLGKLVSGLWKKYRVYKKFVAMISVLLPIARRAKLGEAISRFLRFCRNKALQRIKTEAFCAARWGDTDALSEVIQSCQRRGIRRSLLYGSDSNISAEECARRIMELRDETLGFMPLIHIASKSGNVDLAKFMIERGASIYDKNSLGETALHHTVEAGDSLHAMTDFLLEQDPALMLESDAVGRTPYDIVEDNGGLEGFAFTSAILARAIKKLDEKLKNDGSRGKNSYGKNGDTDCDQDSNMERITSSNQSNHSGLGDEEHSELDALAEENLILSPLEYILPSSLPPPPNTPVYRTYAGVPLEIAFRPSVEKPRLAPTVDQHLVPLFTTLAGDKLFYRDDDTGEWVEDADYFGPKNATTFPHIQKLENKQKEENLIEISNKSLDTNKDRDRQVMLEQERVVNSVDNINDGQDVNQEDERKAALQLQAKMLAAALKAQDNPYGFTIPEIDLDPASRRSKRREKILSLRSPHFKDMKSKSVASSTSQGDVNGKRKPDTVKGEDVASTDKDKHKHKHSAFLGSRGDPVEAFLMARASGKFQ